MHSDKKVASGWSYSGDVRASENELAIIRMIQELGENPVITNRC